MRILLVTPMSLYTPIRWTPLGISYISALLKKNNHEVKLYDRFLISHKLKDEDIVNQEMKKEIQKYNPDIIGFATYSPFIFDTAECVRFLRTFYNGIVVAGGHHATAMPALTLKKIPDLDYVCAGESEYTMLKLADNIDTNNIEGLFSKKTAESGFNNAHIVNLDELPIPDYKIFDMDYYSQANRDTIRGFFLRSACIITSRGCVNNCSFCSESLTFGKGVRFHGTEYVIENIQKLVMDYNIEGIYFHDNNFLASRSRAEDICKKIIKNNLNKKIKWAIQANTINIDGDILKLLSKAGCIMIEMGLESLKESSLKSVNKKFFQDINEKVLRMCKENNIKVHAYFIRGFKEETIEDLENLISWIKKNKPHTFSLSMLKVYPGTALYKNLKCNFFEENIWTRNNINNFFRADLINTTLDEQKTKWYHEKFRPFQKRHNLISSIKSNSLKSIFKMAYKKFIKS